MAKDSRKYLEHIVETADKIKQFSGGSGEEFLKQGIVYYAIIRCLQNMAESASRLDESIKERHSKIEWKKIKAFRNILVHDYIDEIDPKEVWAIVENNIPQLVEIAKRELENDTNT